MGGREGKGECKRNTHAERRSKARQKTQTTKTITDLHLIFTRTPVGLTRLPIKMNVGVVKDARAVRHAWK